MDVTGKTENHGKDGMMRLKLIWR